MGWANPKPVLKPTRVMIQIRLNDRPTKEKIESLKKLFKEGEIEIFV